MSVSVRSRTSPDWGLSSGRKAKDRAFSIAMRGAAVVALAPLVAIVAYVVAKGVPALHLAFFTQTPAPYGQRGGGISQAFLGTILMVGMACLFSIPLGLLTAVYLSEFGRGKVAGLVRFVAEILLATPSIVAGAFIWALFVVRTGSFSAFAGALALSVLMWPVIARATEDVLHLVPQELREGALALGVPRWKVVVRVVIPTAGSAIFTAVMLAVARGLGETAPILLTALGNDYVNWNPMKPTDAVPLRIYNYVQSPLAYLKTLAWGGALVLLGTVLVLSITARILSRRERERMR